MIGYLIFISALIQNSIFVPSNADSAKPHWTQYNGDWRYSSGILSNVLPLKRCKCNYGDEMREQIDLLSESRRGSQSITRHTWNAGELARPWDSPAKEFSR
jgi:hypothetical protein